MKKQRILVLGLGVSGRSAAVFLMQQGAEVWGVDSNRDLLQQNPELQLLQQQGLKTASDDVSIAIEQFDYVVVSPGISPQHPLYSDAKLKGVPCLGEVELACRHLKGKFLGVTGTNGKTTVTLLANHVLQQSGFPSRAVGNVGVPLTSQIGTNSEGLFVLELSSFQLDTMHTPVLDAAVLLNITPDHLDRYNTMEAYAKSKMQIADCLKPDGILYIEERCHRDYGYLLKKKSKTYGYSDDCDIHTDLFSLFVGNKLEGVLPSSLQGKESHDLENMMAAYALCRSAGITFPQFLSGLATFQKPAHRIEYVATVNQVHFYDDSKGTNLDAVIRAVEVLGGKSNLILIAGGVDKGAAYSPWIDAFKNKVKGIIAIGQAAVKIEGDLAHAISVQRATSLEEALKIASKSAISGDTVLLSPGCSSFDMFRDYKHRGQEFQRIVHGMKENQNE